MNQTVTIYARARGGMERRSIGHQLAVCRQAAARIGATITAEYIDQGCGQKHPARERMLADLDTNHRGDLLVISSYDRLTRNYELWDRIFSTLERAGVRLVAADSVGEGTSLATGLLVQRIHEGICRYHAAQRRTSATTIHRKERA